ncbi:MAG: hypothetical protein GY842_17895 [bacterium]|nr:hypothetical protein [bacterium]
MRCTVRMMARISYALIAACAVAMLAGSASANVLSNPGFELGSGADATDWAELTQVASGLRMELGGSC